MLELNFQRLPNGKRSKQLDKAHRTGYARPETLLSSLSSQPDKMVDVTGITPPPAGVIEYCQRLNRNTIVDNAIRLTGIGRHGAGGLLIQVAWQSMTMMPTAPVQGEVSNVGRKVNDVQLLVSRVNNVARRLEAIAEKAAIAGVAVLDGLNSRTTTKSVSTLEDLCDDVESRLERLRETRRAG